MADTLAPRGVIGVMTPAMNTVVQPELEMLRPKRRHQPDAALPAGRGADLGGPDRGGAQAHGLQPGCDRRRPDHRCGTGGRRLSLLLRCRELADAVGVPVRNASEADHAALSALGARRVAVVTPFTADVDRTVPDQRRGRGLRGGRHQGHRGAVAAGHLRDAAWKTSATFFTMWPESDCDAVLQVGTALPVVALLDALERETGKPIVACNAAVYWQTLRAAGIADRIAGFGRLLSRGFGMNRQGPRTGSPGSAGVSRAYVGLRPTSSRERHAPLAMRSHAQVVVIGGGAVGAACLWHLTRAGVRRLRADREGRADLGLDLACRGQHSDLRQHLARHAGRQLRLAALQGPGAEGRSSRHLPAYRRVLAGAHAKSGWIFFRHLVGVSKSAGFELAMVTPGEMEAMHPYYTVGLRRLGPRRASTIPTKATSTRAS